MMFESVDTMEARAAEVLPEGEGWWYEPKWDGFRCVLFKDGDRVWLQGRSGKRLERFFPEISAFGRGLAADQVVLDGELTSPHGFSALQSRLHPSESRIARLSQEEPAALHLFDRLLGPRGEDLRTRPFHQRRQELEELFQSGEPPGFHLTPGVRERARACAWLRDPHREGVVAKRLDLSYRAGERAMVKVKRLRTADCVVGGFRRSERDGLVASLLLGLYDGAGRLDHVGFVSNFGGLDRGDLTAALELAAGGLGFDGRAPGGPSRWTGGRSVPFTPLRPELVVEVAFDQVEGDRIRHGARFVRLRPDKAPASCGLDQLAA